MATTTKTAQFDFLNATDIKALAQELERFINENKLFSLISGKRFVNVEAWQYAGNRLGLSARVVEAINESSETHTAYFCTCEIVHVESGTIVGKGHGVCENSEQGKKFYGRYAILGMAESRSVSRAYRNTIAFLIRLAGFEPTPAEEMDTFAEQSETDQVKQLPAGEPIKQLPVAKPSAQAAAPAKQAAPAQQPATPAAAPAERAVSAERPVSVAKQPGSEPIAAPQNIDSPEVATLRQLAVVRSKSPALGEKEQKNMHSKTATMTGEKLKTMLDKLSEIELGTSGEVRQSVINYHTAVAQRLLKNNLASLPVQWEDELKTAMDAAKGRTDDKALKYLQALQLSIISEAQLNQVPAEQKAAA